MVEVDAVWSDYPSEVAATATAHQVARDRAGRLLEGWHQIRCNDTVGFVRYHNGVPIELRTRCRNRRCSGENREETATHHHWDLVGARALQQRDFTVPRVDPRRLTDQEN